MNKRIKINKSLLLALSLILVLEVIALNFDYKSTGEIVKRTGIYQTPTKVNLVPGRVFLYHSIHTEMSKLNNLNLRNYNPKIDFSDYEKGAAIDQFMNETWRKKYNDSYGKPNTASWAIRMDNLLCSQPGGCNIVLDRFLTNTTNNFSSNISYFGDSVDWHYHHMTYFNCSAMNSQSICPTNDAPYSGLFYWNQLLTFNGTIYTAHNGTNYINYTDIGIAKNILAHFILDYNQYPLIMVNGWVWENTDWSNWIDKFIPMRFNNIHLTNIISQEPIQNVYDWFDATSVFYKPSSLNYKKEGNQTSYQAECLSDTSKQKISLENAFARAQNTGQDQVFCFYSHSYSVMKKDVEKIMSYLKNYTNLNGSCETNDGICLSRKYPEVKFVYGNDSSMLKAVTNKTIDNINPIINASKGNSQIFVNSNEDLWNPPIIAVKDSNDKYYLLDVLPNGLRQWTANFDGINISKVKLIGIDKSYNVGYLTELGTKKCSDGTLSGQCSGIKYCDNGNLIDVSCDVCGCVAGNTCQKISGYYKCTATFIQADKNPSE